MTKKLEEEFNLPSIEELMPDVEPAEVIEPTVEDTEKQIVQYKHNLSIAERADAALPMVTGMEQLDKEMDDYAKKAMETFEDLCEKLSRVASRSTIQAILVDGVNRKYLLKSIDQNDKRKKYFSCENIKGELDLWYKNNKAIYN